MPVSCILEKETYTHSINEATYSPYDYDIVKLKIDYFQQNSGRTVVWKAAEKVFISTNNILY